MPTIAEQLTQLTQDRDDLVDNLTTKGITGLTGDETFTELVPEVLNIPSGGGTVEVKEKDVNFYDYDGTRLYSYTASEFANLTELPANPSHEGLTAQGWNWGLSDAKTYVADYGELDVGQLYVTDDNSTRLYINVPVDNFEVKSSMYGTKTIDWGDGTIQTSSTAQLSHTYTNQGKYVIKISSSGNVMLQGNSYSGALYITKDPNFSSSENLVVFNCIEKIEMGNNVSIENYGFRDFRNLKEIVFNCIETTLPANLFEKCSNLKCIVLKNTITSIGNYVFRNNIVNKVVLPNTITSIGEQSFNNVQTTKITLSEALQTIGYNAFGDNFCRHIMKITSSVNNIAGNGLSARGVIYFDFSLHTSIPTLASNGFGPLAGYQKIIVPDDLYEDWIVATNWSTYASQIVKASEA